MTSNINQTASPNLKIVDYKVNTNNLASSKITVDQSGIVEQITVTVKLNHGYLSDLIISLTDPTGSEHILQSKKGGNNRSHPEQTLTFTLQDTKELKKLVGKKCKGDWKLNIKDAVGSDDGTFKEWTLDLNIKQNRLQISKGGYVSIPHNNAYNFGKGAFSVMAYICPNKIVSGKTTLTEGTICSSKPAHGAIDNSGRKVKGGGWQLFLEKEGCNALFQNR